MKMSCQGNYVRDKSSGHALTDFAREFGLNVSIQGEAYEAMMLMIEAAPLTAAQSKKQDYIFFTL